MQTMSSIFVNTNDRRYFREIKGINLGECRQFRKLDIFEFIIALAVGLLYFIKMIFIS